MNEQLSLLLQMSSRLRKQQPNGDILPVLFPLMTLLEQCDLCIKTAYQDGAHLHACNAMAANNLHLALPAVWGWLENQATMPEPNPTDMLRLDGHLMDAPASRRYLLVRSLIASFVIFEGLWKAAVACREAQEEDAIEDTGQSAIKLIDGILSLRAPNKLFAATCKLKNRMAQDLAARAVDDPDPSNLSDDWFYQVRMLAWHATRHACVCSIAVLMRILRPLTVCAGRGGGWVHPAVDGAQRDEGVWGRRQRQDAAAAVGPRDDRCPDAVLPLRRGGLREGPRGVGQGGRRLGRRRGRRCLLVAAVLHHGRAVLRRPAAQCVPAAGGPAGARGGRGRRHV